MSGGKILVLEGREGLAAWVEEKGRMLGLDVAARQTTRDVEDELLEGLYSYVIGHLNGDGEHLAKIPGDVRPRLIPLLPPSSSPDERKTRIGLILEAISRGNRTEELYPDKVLDQISRWIDSNFEEEMDRRHEAFLRDLSPALGIVGRLDRHVGDHSRRVGLYARHIGISLGLDRESVRLLTVGGWVHDVGKVRIPDATLNKPSPLEPGEWESMLAHPAWGAEIVEPCSQDARLLDMVLHHHERVDGRGYPGGLKGREIPPLARVMAVADAYDAVTHDRPYRKRAAHRAAVREILRHTGSQFDPAAVRAFLTARLDRLSF